MSLGAHIKDVNMVPYTVREAGVSLNVKTCCFYTHSVKYLGNVIKTELLTIDEARFKSFSQLQYPKNVA